MESSFGGANGSSGGNNNSEVHEVKELVNTLKVANSMAFNKANIVYNDPLEGINVMGLVAIKNCSKNTAKGPTEALRFVFKHKDIENCFVNHTVTSRLHEKSNLFKCMQSMLPGLMDPMPDAPKAFDLLKETIGQWFNVMVSKNEFNSKTDGKKIKRFWVVGAYIKPTDTGLGDCRVYFHDKKQPNQAAAEVKSGFESYDDAKKIEPDYALYKFVYDLSKIKPEKLESAKKLIVSQAGVVTQDNTGLYKGYCSFEVTPLNKFRITTADDDQIPF